MHCLNSQVVYSERGAELSLVDQNALNLAKSRIIQLLYPIPDGSLTLQHLLQKYKEIYSLDCPLSFLTDYMEDVVTVSRFTCDLSFYILDDYKKLN